MLVEVSPNSEPPMAAIAQAGTNASSDNTAARNLFTWDDHIYWSRGKHQIEAGVWLQRVESNGILAQNQNGQASFNTLASFLQGQVRSLSMILSPTELGWRTLEGAAFIEETWKPVSRLTLRAGFRFEGDQKIRVARSNGGTLAEKKR